MNTSEGDLVPKAHPAFSGGNPPKPPVTTAAGMAGDSDDFRHSHMYQTFLKEREEINKFRESESAKAGHDIGFEKALLTWIVEYRKEWREKNS